MAHQRATHHKFLARRDQRRRLHQIYFGTNRYGLTPQQLSRIRFRNPERFPAGDYPARLRRTGELVRASRPVLTVARAGQNLHLQWPDGYTLQIATNVLGPFSDLPVTSPAEHPATGPKGFFRLRR